MSTAPVRWNTASFGDSTSTSPMDLQTLSQHVNGCSMANGRLLALRCAASRVQDFVASRLISALVVAVLLSLVALRLV